MKLAQKRKAIKKKNGLDMSHTLGHSTLVWKRVPHKGRGVFTIVPIKKGEMVEVSPAIPMHEKNVPDDDAPDGYVLEWNLKKRSEKYALGLGYVMLYNHSSKPNVDIEANLRNKTFEVIALRNIKPGEELVWDYDCDGVWFKEK
jgi:uncharacterized protein